MKKYFFQTSIAILCAINLMLTFISPGFAQGNTRADYEKLKQDYDRAVAERDNLLIQTKNLLEYKNKVLDAESKLKAFQEERDKIFKNLQQEKEAAVRKLQEQNDRQLLEIATLKEQAAQSKNKSQEELAAFQQRITDLEKKNIQLTQDKEAIQDSLEKLEIEYKIIPETRKKVSRLESEKYMLLGDYKKMEQKLKRLEEDRLERDAQIEIYRIQIKDLKKQYEEALATNKQLQAKAEQVPARFAELARENKVLIKETAMMHYNLGVFYTKNKEFPRAIAEFEKSIELNPDDPYGHYNLGYIYAEYLVDRPKAVQHFRKFLSLSKTEDKDADWVKRYILTWQTWEGKKPIK